MRPDTHLSYVDWLADMKETFSDLRLENQPYRQIIDRTTRLRLLLCSEVMMKSLNGQVSFDIRDAPGNDLP